MTQRVLFVAYLFPPVGGAGVQRTSKFVKYLPEFGWLPSVLTAANPSVPLYDRSLLDDVPPELLVRRARTWEPGYALKASVAATDDRPTPGFGLLRGLFKAVVRTGSNLVLQPDAQVLWLPRALREGRQLLEEVPHDAIIATGPPFSTFLVGAALSQHSGLPLVLDYRDEWGLCNTYSENRAQGPVTQWVQWRMQRRVVRQAQVLLATTRSSARALDAVRRRAAASAQVSWIYNGYDPDDFADFDPPCPLPDRPYRLAYVGTLWNLTSVRPLVDAVGRLTEQRPELVSCLELVFAGRRTGAQQQILDRLKGLPCRVVEHPYTDHRGAIEVLRRADGLCVLLSEVAGAERVVPAKVFEYMAARRPVLAIAPLGELADLLRDHPAARHFTPSDIAGIAQGLAAEIERHRAGRPAPLDGWDASMHDRRRQAQRLARLLSALNGRPVRQAQTVLPRSEVLVPS
jgi:glycosyltransferase involved in cell wall biosynthesis